MVDAVKASPVEILLVEDNDGDVRLTREALHESQIYNNLYSVRDGIDALAFLRKQEPYWNASTPDLILLDLNMPRMNGRELLSIIKTDDDLKRIPVVILTTSNDIEDIAETYKLHANCFVTKPVELDQFIQIVKEIHEFWFSVVRLPNGSKING